MITIIVIAPTYRAASRLAKARSYPSGTWYWCSSRTVADRWVERCRSMGVDLNELRVFA